MIDPLLFFTAILVAGLLLATASVIALSGRLRHSEWVLSLSISALIGAVIYSWASTGAVDFPPEILSRGWIWSRDEAVALHLNWVADPAGFAAVLFLAVTALALAIFGSSDRKGGKLFGALGLSVLGASIAWISGSPWLALIGVSVALIGGVLSFASQWRDDAIADVATRYAKENARALLIAVLGAAMMASVGENISLAPSAEINLPDPLALPGMILFALGLLLIIGFSPLQGWSARGVGENPALRFACARMFPALAAAAVFWRARGSLEALEILPAVSWSVLALATLTALTAFLQADWQRALSIWFSAVVLASVGLLGIAGPWSALAALFAAVGAAAPIGMLAEALQKGGTASNANKQKAASAKVFLFAAVYAGICGPGFVGAGAWMQAFLGTRELPVAQAALGAVLLFITMAGLRVAISAGRTKDHAQIPMSTWLAAALPWVFTMGWIWSGSLTGGLLPDGADVLTVAVLPTLYASSLSGIDPEAGAPVAWTTLGGVTFAAGLFVWLLFRNETDGTAKLRKAYPATTAALAESEWVDKVGAALSLSLRWVGAQAEEFIDRKFWADQFPSFAAHALRRISALSAALDGGVSRWLPRVSKIAVGAPSRVFQLIQSGDAQWYLFFAIGSALAILLNFLRVNA